ncbi:hypothetical protein DL98DRAFT_112780 [Cadophora sp. DSE1049]|nr:hypothetical protein DL98DRAFT_112780 [Cadophora sp. DSE1049]
MTRSPPPPVHEVTKTHQGITMTHVIELKWEARLKRSARTVPTLEERVQELLRTANNRDTIRHICQLYPFRDQNIPRIVLSRRWDSCLDSFLIFLHGVPRAQDILQLSGEEKAEKLLGLLDPAQERKSTMWAWSPPVPSGKPGDISEAIYNVISSAFFQVTLREWLAYLDGSKVAAVDWLLIAFGSISTYIQELDPQKYNMLEKVTLHK